MSRRLALIGSAACLTLSLAACTTPDKRQLIATATMQAVGTEQTHALVQFYQSQQGGVELWVMAEGLSPGEHGFHLHQNGDCGGPGASLAGGHFNPRGLPHGHREGGQRHLGDFPNLKADENGQARARIFLDDLTLSGPNSALGRALIIHQQADDYISQPAGNSGPRIACGVITPPPAGS